MHKPALPDDRSPWPARAAASRLRRVLPALAAGLAAGLAFVASAAAQPATAMAEVIVAFRDDAPTVRRHPLNGGDEGEAARRVLAARAEATGLRLGRSLQAGRAVGRRVQLMRAEGVDAETLARQLAADPEVAYAVPNGRKWRLAVPNDPLYATSTAATRPRGPASGQWYLRAPTATVVSSINAEAAWDRTRGNESVVVAVLDTGVRFEHPDLGRVADGGRLLPGYDFVDDITLSNDGDGRDADPSDPGDFVTNAEQATSRFSDCSTSSSWHGTATASLVGAAASFDAAAPGVGMAGTAPGARVLPVRVLGKCFGTDADIIAGMRWAAGLPVDGVPANPNPARVLNLSLGGSGACGVPYQVAVREIVAAGVVVVAAAGNSVGGSVNEPANCPGVIGVLALRHAGTKVGFSDMGPEIAIAAPGGNCVDVSPGAACRYPILAATDSGLRTPVSSTWTDSFDITVGTSFAAPLVSGVAALMLSERPELTPAQLREALQSTARPFPTTGADNGDDPTPVPSCTRVDLAGASGQCYCTTGLCGAGMVDAGAAVAAVSGVVARIEVPAGATVGQSLTLSAAGSLASPGQSIVGWNWVLVSADAGVASGFSSATNAPTATLLPGAAGSFTVRLTVTDSAGLSRSTETVVSVASAGGGGGGGGGSSGERASGSAGSVGWVLALAVAAARLRRLDRTGRR